MLTSCTLVTHAERSEGLVLPPNRNTPGVHSSRYLHNVISNPPDPSREQSRTDVICR